GALVLSRRPAGTRCRGATLKRRERVFFVRPDVYLKNPALAPGFFMTFGISGVVGLRLPVCLQVPGQPASRRVLSGFWLMLSLAACINACPCLFIRTAGSLPHHSGPEPWQTSSLYKAPALRRNLRRPNTRLSDLCCLV